ncbi:MAG: FtsX-like permease family protein [Rubritepida sp.]|nr:FtsX-like permease family protein [Rubritepida sp.]
MTAVLTRLLERLLGRLPIGWLQLVHKPGRFAAAVAGVAFANLLVLMQLGFLGALTGSISLPYRALEADILVQSSDANTLQDGTPLPRARMLEALAVPGVASATTVYVGRLDWRQPDGSNVNLDVLGIDPGIPALRLPEVEAARPLLAAGSFALVDRATRGLDPVLRGRLEAGGTQRFEANGHGVTVTGTFSIGGGFGADGFMVVSDQTFLRLFRNRSPGAPNLVLLRAAPGEDIAALVARVRAALPARDIVVRSVMEAAAADTTFQTTRRPVGIIFGFGVAIGVLVGGIIVYQVLSTDVADHLREYATFKAMGYGRGTFLAIVLEEAMILALAGVVPGALAAAALYAGIAAMTGLPLTLGAPRLASVFVGTIVLCLLSGTLATRRLARADPAELF